MRVVGEDNGIDREGAGGDVYVLNRKNAALAVELPCEFECVLP